jgi:hypothetical protein
VAVSAALEAAINDVRAARRAFRDAQQRATATTAAARDAEAAVQTAQADYDAKLAALMALLTG